MTVKKSRQIKASNGKVVHIWDYKTLEQTLNNLTIKSHKIKKKEETARDITRVSSIIRQRMTLILQTLQQEKKGEQNG